MDYTSAEADLWKVSYLIAQSTSERGAIIKDEPPREDKDMILSWAKAQPTDFTNTEGFTSATGSSATKKRNEKRKM